MGCQSTNHVGKVGLRQDSGNEQPRNFRCGADRCPVQATSRQAELGTRRRVRH
jgi:hypothetical protein